MDYVAARSNAEISVASENVSDSDRVRMKIHRPTIFEMVVLHVQVVFFLQ